MNEMLSLHDIQQAARRIAPHVSRTPLLGSEALNTKYSAELAYKAENLQRIGAFKARGGVNAVFALDDAAAAKGVATHSSGNHGAALARAAKLRGIPAYIVVPQGANPVKRANIARFGAEIIECEPTMAGREQALEDLVARTGATVVHPYADTRVMAGQGTVALEVLEEFPDPDIVLVPLGGGGLISGCATVLKSLAPGTRVIGIEPDGAADALASFKAGEVIPVDSPDTIADGLRATVGEPNLAVIRERVDDIVTVSDVDIVRAMHELMPALGCLLEPSAVLGHAAIMTGAVDVKNHRVAVILTGGNVDLAAMPGA
ncbi:MAG: threonine/serine dehydratase [Gammaproteobacteria bacterium]|nr:threonine/serine dehydratase [Gammaproteobacteria bacterium]